MDKEQFRQARKPVTPGEDVAPTQHTPEDTQQQAADAPPPTDRELLGAMQLPPGTDIQGPIPEAFKQVLLNRAKDIAGVPDAPPSPSEQTKTQFHAPQQATMRPQQSSLAHQAPLSNGPRLAFSGDNRLDELLASIGKSVNRYEEITLPSRGKFYDGKYAPSNGVLHVRAMTGEEEQILATPRYIKKGQAINMIFRNCVQENINPEALLTIDRTYLLIYLRGISYSADYEVEVKCPECGARFSTTIDLDSLRVNYCPNDFGEEQLSDVLPTSQFRFTYRLATAADDNAITQHRDRRLKLFGDQAADDTWIFRASLLVTDIEGVNDQMTLQALIGRLPINDVAYLRNVVNDPPFGVDTKVQIVCPSCTEEFEIEMPMETNFFFPRRKKAKHTQV